ncbi:MAG: PorV/PorQ family protein [Elusimicrobiota bacterium]
MIKKIVCFLLLSSIFHLPAAYAAGEPGGFMYWGAGGRAMGMGNASVGAVNDAFALYWNPGALGTLESKELATFHSILWEETSFSFLGYVHPTLNKGVFGASLVRLFSGNADKRDDNNVSVGSFNHSQIAVGLSYGKNLHRNIFWGATGKFMSLTLDTFAQNAFTFDTGLYIPMGKNRNPTVGLTLQNVISGMLSETDDKLPIVFKIGTAYKLFGDRLLIAFDIGRKSRSAAIDTFAIGAESAINKMFTVRLGRNQDETAAGFGVNWKNFKLDYAMALHYLGSSHRVSFNTKFGATLGELRKTGPDEAEGTMTPAEEAERDMIAEKFREIFQNAIALYRRGLYKQSYDKFTQSQNIDPKDIDVPLYLDRIGLLTPIVPQVISPDKTSDLLRRGITYFIEGDGQSAVKTVAYSLSTEPDNFTISRVLSRIEEKTGLKADYSKPVSGMSIVDQKLFESLIAFRKKDYSRVIQLCEDVLVLEPQNILALKRLGSAFFALGEKEKALSTWEKAQELQSDPKIEELINKLKSQ